MILYKENLLITFNIIGNKHNCNNKIRIIIIFIFKTQILYPFQRWFCWGQILILRTIILGCFTRWPTTLHPIWQLYDSPNSIPAWPTHPCLRHHILQMILTQEIIIVGFWKLTKWHVVCVWVGESFLRMTSDRWHYWVNFCAIHIQPLWMTQTQKIITCRVSKIYKLCEGIVWVGETFLNHDKWQIKLLSESLCNSHSTFYEWLKLKK